MSERQPVTKGDFARLCNVSPGRVTQWIDEGKISGAALVGEGRSAKIDVEAAQQQLKLRRDVGQSLGNGIGTRLDRPARVLEDDDEGASGPTDDIDRKLKLAKLASAERANRIAAAEEMAAEGLYTETAVARAEMGRIAGQISRAYEGALSALATAIAAEFKLEDREVKHFLTEQFRRIREQAATAAAEAAAGMSELADAQPA